MTTSRATIHRSILLTVLAGAALAPSALGQTALLREGDAIGGGGFIATGLGNVNTNHAGGYCLGVTASDGLATTSNFWGHATGGLGTLLRTESTFGTLEQTSFESFFGFSDAGEIAYSASSNDTDGSTGLDGVWLDDAVILNEEDPVPGQPGQFSSFNSRPTTTAGGTPWWVGGFTAVQGGSTQNRAFYTGLGSTIVLKGGDALPGVAELISTASTISFDYGVSADGTHWLGEIALDAASTADNIIVMDGSPLMIDGSFVREDSPLPAAAGGLVGENWDNFDYLGVAESGSYLITGNSNGAASVNEFVLIDGEIVLREGAAVASPLGAGTIAGSIESGTINESGDWAVVWDLDLDAGNVEALIVNGEVLVVETMGADMDGDGIADAPATLANFTGIANLALSERSGGMIDVYYTADIDTLGTTTTTDDTEILYRLSVAVPNDCPADLTTSADPNHPGFGVPDGVLDANDFFFYLGLFGAGNLDADLTGSLDPNDPGFGVPDGVLDANDFFFYLGLFAAGCP